MINQKRFRLEQDNSGHWYCIPADITTLSKFEDWYNEDPDYTGPSFDEYRLNMHPCNYSFVDFQEART